MTGKPSLFFKPMPILVFSRFTLGLILVIFTALAVTGQSFTIEEAKINITFPGKAWSGGYTSPQSLGEMAEAFKGYTVYGYVRENLPGTSTKDSGNPFDMEIDAPVSVSILIDRKPVTKATASYAQEKMRLSNPVIIKTYTTPGPAAPLPAIPQVIAYKYLQEQIVPMTGTLSMKGYMAFIVQQNIGIVVTLSSRSAVFDKYDKEFATILRSIVSTITTNTSNTKTPQVSKTINVCDYIPLKKKMSYQYLETSSNPGVLGEFAKLFGGGGTKTLTEEYTAGSTKTISGKIYKGYKVKSNDHSKNGKTFFYLCSNNDQKMNTEIYEWEDEHVADEYQGGWYIGPVYEPVLKPTGRYTTITELKGSIPVGEIWTETEFINGTEAKVSTSIEETGLTLEVNEETYTDVIKIVRTFVQNSGMNSTSLQSEIYYARGIGKIRIVNTITTMLGITANTLDLISYKLE